MREIVLMAYLMATWSEQLSVPISPSLMLERNTRHLPGKSWRIPSVAASASLYPAGNVAGDHYGFPTTEVRVEWTRGGSASAVPPGPNPHVSPSAAESG